MYLTFPISAYCGNVQGVLDHVTTMCPINKNSVLFEFPKKVSSKCLSHSFVVIFKIY
jgi:hypothetical protein